MKSIPSEEISSRVQTTARARRRSRGGTLSLLPIMLLPLLVPIILGAVRATGLAVDGRPWEEIQSWVGILVAYDIMFTTLSALIFHFVVEQ